MPANKKKTINLLPQKDLDASTYGRIIKWLLTSFRFIVIVVEFVVIIGFLSRFWLDTRNADLEEEIGQKKLIIESFASFEEEFKTTQSKLARFSEFSQSKQASPVLNKISSRLPVDVQLDAATISREEITITGLSIKESSIAQFISNLKAEEDFPQVSLITAETQEDTPFVKFTLSIQPTTL